MTVSWLDVSSLSFNALLLLERVQLSWFPGWVNEADLGLALRANPAVEWYLRHKCPELGPWLDGVMSAASQASLEPGAVRQAEVRVLESLDDLITYVVDPSSYDAQEFLQWDSSELTSLVDFTGRTVVDVGSGTGRLALVAAPLARAVFAVEPVANLRYYLKVKARRLGFTNVHPVDGFITDLPFPPGFAQVTMGGHVFGDAPEAELAELERVTQPGGMIILCPGTSASEETRHLFLFGHGFDWQWFIEPPADRVRKYWRRLPSLVD